MFSATLSKSRHDVEDLIALPRFVEPEESESGTGAGDRPKSQNKMMQRSVARAASIVAMPTRGASVFQSKGWDALFQAAQDMGGFKTALAEEESGETQASGEGNHQGEPGSRPPRKKPPKARKPSRAVDHFYQLLDETPEEAAEREQRMRERRQTRLSLHEEQRKKWMTAHGRVRAGQLPLLPTQLLPIFSATQAATQSCPRPALRSSCHGC